jgi:orotidine-5'-phosphate decarboxylase
MKSPSSKIIIALDYPSADAALAFVDRLEAGRCRLKVGKELFTRSGPHLVESLQQRGFEVFLDLKYHDIPNTVAAACRAAAAMGVWMVNVHALGGEKMMQAAREAIDKSQHATRLIAVTLLTSMGQEDLAAIGIRGTPAEVVLRLAKLSKKAGLDGVVCSPQEIDILRKDIQQPFDLVTPGIRPAGATAVISNVFPPLQPQSHSVQAGW